MAARESTAFDRTLDWVGRHLATKLSKQSSGYNPYTPSDFDTLCRTLLPGDVVLIEGNERISVAIKYLTQSTWSHAALYIGETLPAPEDGSERARLIEVNLGRGCEAVELSKYETYNTRICRPLGLSARERAKIVAFMVGKLGLRYDMRNIFDLLRYFFPTPPVPVRWRRRLLAVGSGDPTRAICSSLIAQAFQSIHYPILPDVTTAGKSGAFAQKEIYHIRHHSLFTPRDFDLSPFFNVIKPNLMTDFDHRRLVWAPPERPSSEQ